MKLPILHLVDGIHQFEQVLKPESLNFYRQALYPHPLRVEVELNKFERNIQSSIRVETTARYECDRCLAVYEKPLMLDFHLLFRIGKDTLQTEEDEVVVLPAETLELDLSEWIQEQLVLAIPMKMLCSEDCKGICAGCGANLNDDVCSCAAPATDPRWDKLKTLRK